MGRDLAIDLGSANTLVYRQGDGIVFDEPTVVALHGGTGEVVAMGEEAWQMLGGESGNVLAVRPLREGTMTEFDVTQRMLAVVLRRVGVTRFPKPRVLVCVPPLSTNVERRAIERAIRYAGGRHQPADASRRHSRLERVADAVRRNAEFRGPAVR